ncbi:hypothetical protein IWZ00DRAFT_513656, partial [Phyllosticta capitalensis]
MIIRWGAGGGSVSCVSQEQEVFARCCLFFNTLHPAKPHFTVPLIDVFLNNLYWNHCAMSGDAQPCAPHIEPFERAKRLFLDQLSEDERLLYEKATPENLFYHAKMFHDGYQRSSKLQAGRDALMPIVRIIEGYGPALDTWSNAAFVNMFMAPIWGSLRVVIHIAQKVDEYFENLIEMFRQIGDILPHIRDYQRLFPKHGRLMLLLSESLASILTFCKKVKDHFNNEKTAKTRPNKLLGHKASWKKIKISVPNYLEDFEKLKRRIEEEAQLSHMIEDKEHHDRQEEHWALQEGRLRETRLKEALSTLSKVNYKNQHRQLRSEQYAGTGEWLIQEPSFAAWVERPASSCFYCFGIPGSGKSVLSSAIVDHLYQEFTAPEDIHGFYFCDYRDLDSLKCSTLLGTLIRQALDRSPRPQILVDWVLEHVAEGNSQPSTADLVDALKRVMGSRKRVFLVLDGIDELDHAEQNNLRRAMQSFVTLKESVVKIFVSCRAGVIELDSDPYLAVKLTITPDHVRNDILHYIDQIVESKYRSGELQLGNISLKQEIIQALSAGANEMFLWVTFQIEELCLCYNDEEIQETLSNLPEGLADTYARILQRILTSKRGPRSLEIAYAAFQWVICSARPLLVEELLEAIAIRRSDSTLHRNRVMKDTRKLIQACGNLITIQIDGTVRPAHHTVQQFLVRDGTEIGGKPYGPLNRPVPYSEKEYVATNAGSVNSNHLHGIEHMRFFFEEGDQQLGYICIAYLQFEDFQSQVAIREPNRIQMPAEIVNSIGSGSLGPSTATGKVMSKFRGFSKPGTDIGNITLSIPKLGDRDKEKSLDGGYKLLEYVRSFWPFHLDEINLRNNDKKVAEITFIREYPFEMRPWKTSQFVKSIPRYRGARRSQQYHDRRLLFYWALKYKVRFFHDLLKSEEPSTPDLHMEHGWDRNDYSTPSGIFRVIILSEAAQDTPEQNLLQAAAKWGPCQLSWVLNMFACIGFPDIPIKMLHQAFAVGSFEVRRFLYNRIYNHSPSDSDFPGEDVRQVFTIGKPPGALPDIAFDDWPGNARFLSRGQSTPWFARAWRDLSAGDPRRIMSEMFVLSWPKDPDVMITVFPFLESDDKNDAIGRIIREAKSDIEKASDDTKRNFIIETLVGILFPDHGKLLSSIRIESGMGKWQDKWDDEVDEAQHRLTLRLVKDELKKEPEGDKDRENTRRTVQELVRRRRDKQIGRESVNRMMLLEIEIDSMISRKEAENGGIEHWTSPLRDSVHKLGNSADKHHPGFFSNI